MLMRFPVLCVLAAALLQPPPHVAAIILRTFKSTTDCPEGEVASMTVLASNDCVAMGAQESGVYSCSEKAVMLTQFTNSDRCLAGEGGEITVTKIANDGKCVVIGDGAVLYDCSAAAPANRFARASSAALLACVATGVLLSL